MSISIADEGKKRTISINGRFDFTLHKEFRNSYKDAAADAEFEVNASGMEYMDSSALGMLLLLREHAEGNQAGKRVKIVGCNDEIKKILDVSNFSKLFDIA